ncbi:MAG: alpha/beta hydrolase [Eubacteriales bacterium]|nr:alpha/beta hydrolase [Eubacteriales bacterium]
MKTGSVKLWEKEEYTYPAVGEFIPNIHYYLHDEDDQMRPAVVVVPGGAYRVVSHTEGEIVALDFYERGYNTFVVTYTTNIINQQALRFQPLQDISAAVSYVRANAENLHVVSNKVTVCGFSAGSHLTGSLAVHWDAPEVQAIEKCQNNRPDAVILSYPVITSGEYAHRDSFVALLGEDATEEELEYMSLEKQVTPNTPPVFLWQTVTDETVPVENSYLMAEACKKNDVPYEHHVFPQGPHGMSLGNEKWAAGDYAGTYTMEQTIEVFQMMLDNGITLPSPFDQLNIPKGTNIKPMADETIRASILPQNADQSVAMWPTLADLWMKRF